MARNRKQNAGERSAAFVRLFLRPGRKRRAGAITAAQRAA